MSIHYPARAIELTLNRSDDDTFVVVLAADGTAWNPASTHTLVHGPALVVYTRYADGGIDAAVTYPDRGRSRL